MQKATYIGIVPLNFIKLPPNRKPWEPYETEDIIACGLVTVPKHYMLTTGSGIYWGPHHTASSLATTPRFQLPTTSQMYIAGRDVIRWGGELDPYEIDYDHYLFTPDIAKGVAVVSKAPKSELHHFSQAPDRIEAIPESWIEIFEGVRKGKFP